MLKEMKGVSLLFSETGHGRRLVGDAARWVCH
jgi:hypothetical protein